MLKHDIINMDVKKQFTPFLELCDPHKKHPERVVVYWGLFNMWHGLDATDRNPLKANEQLKTLLNTTDKESRMNTSNVSVKLFWEVFHQYSSRWEK